MDSNLNQNQKEAYQLEDESLLKKQDEKIVEKAQQEESKTVNWTDPFELVIKEKIDDSGQLIEQETPKQFQRMWFFFEDEFQTRLVKIKDQIMELLQVLLLVSIYAFFGMFIIIYYICYPANLERKPAASKYEAVPQQERKERQQQGEFNEADGDDQNEQLRKRKSFQTRAYSIPELMATLWYNLSHLIFWKSTIQLGDEKEKDIETIKREIRESLERGVKKTKESFSSKKQNNKLTIDTNLEAEEGEKNNQQKETLKSVQSPTGGEELKPQKKNDFDQEKTRENQANAPQGTAPAAPLSIDLDLFNQNSIESQGIVEPTFTAREMGYTKQKRVVFFGIQIPFEAALYGIFLGVGIMHFYLLVASIRARPNHLLQLILLSMCWGYLLLNLVFISIWLVGMSVGNWHRKREQPEVFEQLLEKSQIPANSFFLQFLGQLSNRSLWSEVGAFQNTEELDKKFKIDSELEWRSGLGTLHYYLNVFHQYSLSHFRYCIPENKQPLYVQYEKQLTLLNPRQFNQVYADQDPIIRKNTKGFWLGNFNFSCVSLIVVIMICTRFLFLIIAFFVDHFSYTNAVNQALANGSDPPQERRSMFFNNVTIFTFFLLIYAVQFIGYRAYSNRLRKLNGLVRLSGLIDYQNVDYEHQNTVPSELPPANVFCLLTLESWYNMRRLLNKLGKREGKIFDLQLTISVGLIALIITVTILGYLNLNNIDWVYVLIRENTLAMFGFYIDFFLLVMIAVSKLCINARINEHGDVHKKLLEKHLYVLKSMNGANIMATNINDKQDFNSKCLLELKKQTKFYLLNGTLDVKEETFKDMIKNGSIQSVAEIKDEKYGESIVAAYARYVELLIEKVETIIQKIEFDEKKHQEVFAFVLPINNYLVYLVMFGSLAILLPLTTGKWIQYDQMSMFFTMVSAKLSGTFWQ